MVHYTQNQNIEFLGADARNNRRTSFQESVVAFRTNRFNYKPTWGISDLRDETSTTGTGASVAESNGEFLLQTGTDGTGASSVVSKERGQYQSGTEGEAGIGVRIPTLPTGSQSARWGLYDDNNGFGYGVDATGLFVFRRNSGTETKTYQTAFNKDQVNGNTVSKVNLDLAEGNIFQISFVWYGYGSIDYLVNIKEFAQSKDSRVLLHTTQVDEELSIVDPNQPLTVEVDNGGTASNFQVYVGGRQFSVVQGNSESKRRTTSFELNGESVSTTSYVAIASFRKKTNFNGRQNSVNTFLKNIQVNTDNPIYFYLDYGGSVTGGSWAVAPDTKSTETALEHNTTFTGDTANTCVTKAIVGGDKNTPISTSRSEKIAMGQSDEIILYAKHIGTAATTNFVIDFEEEW